MKRNFRYLILGFIFISLTIFVVCNNIGDESKFKEKHAIAEQITQLNEKMTTKEEIKLDYYIVTSNQAKLYSLPSTDSNQVDKLYKNSLLQVETYEDDLWKKVKYDQNTYAYISSSDVRFVGAEYTKYVEYQIADIDEKFALISADVGNIRNLPDMDSEIIGKYKYGETVKILAHTKNDWNIIMYNDNISYISSEVITYISKEEYDSYNFKIEKSEFDDSKSILIGLYSTNYSPINTNRGYNVELASSQINELVIPPNSVFNWCRDMGPCGKEDGYKESTEISNGKYVKGYGGGICQISSTLCAAFLNSDGEFEIIERHKHSKAQSYIPRDLDATVSYPNVNLIIKNCNDFSVMIRSFYDKGIVTIEVYKMK